jgi:hypothetical protein
MSAAAQASSVENSRAAWRTRLLLLALAVWYAILIYPAARRQLWYDELFTYYLARMPTLAQMLDTVRHIDLNPPPEYLLVRLSMFLFGDTEAAVRLPSILAFFAASVVLFFYLRRVASEGYACLGVAALWSSGALHYAAEARPYALVLLFFALLLLCWDTAVTAERRAAALWGVAIANTGMLAAHVFAPLSLLPFLAAELVRFRQRRRPDYALWAALVLPLAVTVLYVPLFQPYSGVVYPPAFQASVHTLPRFYVDVLSPAALGLLLAFGAALLAPPASPKESPLPAIRPGEWTVFAVLLLNPLLLSLALMRGHGAFWPRYCLTSTVALFAGLAVFLARRLRVNRAAGYYSAITLLLFVTFTKALPAIRDSTPRDSLDRTFAELPMVAASGVTFLEMDHYESPTLTSRLYYLNDRPAAIRYAHATLFEDIGGSGTQWRYFPVRAHVEAYSAFIRRNREFVVLGTWDYPEDWLLKKLRDDGAAIMIVGDVRGPYKDKTLYRVSMP